MFSSNRRKVLMGGVAAGAAVALAPHANAQLMLTGAGLSGVRSIVSASNRTRLNQGLTASTGKTTNQWNYTRLLHFAVKAANGMQSGFWNGYFGANFVETACPSYEIVRFTWLTNIVGISSIVSGGIGPPLNQTGCAVTTGTFSQLINSTGSLSDIAHIRDINYNLQSYSAFVTAGGSVTTNLTTNDTVQLPGGWSIESDPGPNVTDGSYYITQVEQQVPLGITGSGQWASVVQQILNSAQRQDLTGTNSTGDYYSQKGGQFNLVTDPNWSTYSGISGGQFAGRNPNWVRGYNSAGAKTIVIDGASEDNGTYEYGDPSGTCGTLQRSCVQAGYTVFNVAVPSTSFLTSRQYGGYAYRLGFVAYATGAVLTGADLNSALSWPTAGTFTPAAANDTSTPVNMMAGIRWWNNQLRTKLPAGGKVGQATFVVGPLGGIVDTLSVTGLTANGTAVGSTVTAVTASAHPFTIGTMIAIAGSTTSGYNISSFVTINSVPTTTSFTYFATAVLGATTAAGTITVTDGFQSLALQQQPTNTSWLPGGTTYLRNDYLMQRNSYAGLASSYSAASGNSDFAVDMRHACGMSEGTVSPANIWPPGPTFKSATVDSGHMGYFTAGVAAPVLAPQIKSAVG